MKKILYTLLLMLAISISYGCSKGDSKKVHEPMFENGIKTIQHDGCEYIALTYQFRSVSMVHKQNCRFCETRNNSN